MNRNYFVALIFTSLSLVASSFASQSPGLTLEVDVQGLKNDRGQILALLFASEDGFPGESAKAIQSLVVPVSSGENILSFSELPSGTYAVALIHDENENGKLDKGTFGIPKEGIGFTRNPKLGMGPPKFEKSSVELTSSSRLTVQMKNY